MDPRTEILAAVQGLCEIELNRLGCIGITEVHEFEYAYLDTVPGVRNYPASLNHLRFTYRGELVTQISYLLKPEYFKNVRVVSAEVIADNMGVYVNSSAKPRVCDNDFTRGIAGLMTAAVKHDHELCVKSMSNY